MKINAAISWLQLAQIISWLQGGHGAVHATSCSYTQCKRGSRDPMFPLPHAPNQLPNQLYCETLAVLAARRIFAPAQLVQK